MYCPQCGAEYQDGVATCADCDVALVVEDPRAVPEDANLQPRGDWSFEPVYRTTNPAEIAAITSALDAGQIAYYVYDQNTSLGMGSVVIEARIVVRSDQVELAEAILEELSLLDTARNDGDDRGVEPEELRGIAAFSAAVGERGVPDGTPSDDAPDALACPDCGAPLEADGSEGIVKHACAHCSGIWFDAKEFTLYAQSLVPQLAGARLPELVYAQPEEVAPCPVCRQLTLHWGGLADMTAARCQRCKGIFLANDSE